MNWQAISFDWNQVRAFYAAVDQGSFSAGARVLGTTQPTIGRQISALEESLGVTLVERGTKGLQVTEVGRDLLDYVRAMSDAASMISMIADRKSQDLVGDVSVAATDLMSSAVLPPILMMIRKEAPGINIRMVASNAIQDLMKRDADIAIRHVRPEQPDLIAKYIGEFGANLYAAKSYLDEVGRPNSLRDIADHAFIANASIDRLRTTMHDQGIEVRPEQFVVSTENGTVAWEWVKAGFGIAIQPDSLGAETFGVERVFPFLPSIPLPVWLVTHRELKTSPRIRLVFDILAHGLKDLGWKA